MSKRKCKVCSYKTDDAQLESNSFICPNCGHYFSYNSTSRIRDLSDNGQFKKLEFETGFYEQITDEKYLSDIRASRNKFELSEAIICGETRIAGNAVLVGVMDSRFMMAGMGHVVGESICQLFKRAIKKKLPVIIFCCSGGARMQEGIISLMQMEKTAAMVKKHNDAGILYISVLTNPTMGGVTASFATLADMIIAEKGAMIGFDGARVIEQNTGGKLPEGFQSADFQKECGFVDAVVYRNDMKETIAFFLGLHRTKPSLKSIDIMSMEMATETDMVSQVRTPWETVRFARSGNRPTSLDYINKLFPDFFELSGDRVDGDDHAVVAGLATFYGFPITVIGQQNGKKSVEDACFRNFGMPSPSGYRKALRLAKQAEKFGRPIIFFVDTIGAACGADAERKGQGTAIATMLYEMSAIRVSVYSIVIGQGGSGGALAFAVGNEVDILENAVYSIITPEGYASIVWRDSAKAAECMKMTSADLYDLRIVNKVIAEQPLLRQMGWTGFVTILDYRCIRFFWIINIKARQALSESDLKGLHSTNEEIWKKPPRTIVKERYKLLGL